MSDGDTAGPLAAVYTPGHAPDHLAYVIGDVALTGDAVLGTGSVFIYPDPGALQRVKMAASFTVSEQAYRLLFVLLCESASLNSRPASTSLVSLK